MTGGQADAAGLILAGGGSRRLGGRKLDLPWGGGTLLSRIVPVMTGALPEVWLVGNHARSIPTSFPRSKVLRDQLRLGPIGGLMLGLEAAEQPVAVVVAADMPFVQADAILRLLELSSGAQVTALRTPDGLHPLFGAYHRGCLPAIRAAISRGERRVTAFWDEVDVRVVDVEDDPFWSQCLFNINSLEDYRRALRMRDDMAAHLTR